AHPDGQKARAEGRCRAAPTHRRRRRRRRDHWNSHRRTLMSATSIDAPRSVSAPVMSVRSRKRRGGLNPFQTLRVALRAIWRNKMRSFLTTLGIIIGVAAVIAMMAIGAGAKAQVEAAFAAMGTNLLIIQSGSSSAGGVRGGFGSQPTLTWDDLAAIRTEVSTVKAAAPQLRSNQSIVGE